MHFDMAEYLDNPVELWHSDAWGTSIQATSGDFAYTAAQKTIFPEDFVLLPADKSLASESGIKYGWVCFVGQDARINFRTTTHVVLQIQTVVSNEFLKRWSQSQKIQEFNFAKATNKKRFLIEDLILECKAADVHEFYSCTLCYTDNHSFNNSCCCAAATTCIQRVVNLETQTV